MLEPPLREEVGSLLAAYQKADSFLESPPVEEPKALSLDTASVTLERDDQTDSRARQQIGPYRILSEIGHGGMGVVYEAEQEKPVHRRVALKLIKWGMDTKAVIARFESERQALALMNHPNIASVYDAGATEQGRPFFAMELVHGEPITEYCDKNRLTIKERLGLFIRVCEGVQHAHQKGIIHRDIKPSNILITIQDSKPVPKIIDFGVAKATSQRLTERTVYTELGQLIGTPEYMSPEQAEMTGIDIDTRTDVYSLGVVLYELLVGAQPFDAKTLRQARFDDMRRKIREDEPPKPSTRLSRLGEPSTTAAKNRRVELRSLERDLQGDLDWITMRALEKDRTRRYGSPSDLAADIERHLTHEPVNAGPPSNIYRATKFVRRHLVGVVSATSIALLLVALLVGMTVQAARIARERDRANREAEVASTVSQFLVGLFEVSDPDEARGKTITAREILDKGTRDIEYSLSGQRDVQARLMITMGKVYTNLGLYEKAEPLLKEALETQRQVLGDQHPNTLTALNEMANLYWHQGRYRDAEPLYVELVESRRRVLGEEHPDTLGAEFDLASLYTATNRNDEAERLILETLEAQRRVLGEEHPDTLSSMGCLSNIYFSLRRYEDAEPINVKILELRRRTLGDNHPDTLLAIHNLAVSYHYMDRYDEAEPLYVECLKAERVILGELHPDTILTTEMLGWLYLKQQRYDEAEARLLAAHQSALSAFGSSNSKTQRIIKLGLIELYEAWGKPEKAAEYRAMLAKEESE
jgi:non-specific serine/threonine protein kinase/serine/threonine-protein kinase